MLHCTEFVVKAGFCALGKLPGLRCDLRLASRLNVNFNREIFSNVQCFGSTSRPSTNKREIPTGLCNVGDDEIFVKNELEEYHFFPQENVKWENLKLNKHLCQSLAMGGYERPAALQVSSIPAVLNDKDVIIAAQTGSGKTLSYLAPIIHLLLEQAVGDTESTYSRGKKFALVLCPNATLCWQVTSMARAIASSLLSQNPSNTKLNVHCLVGGEGWPVNPPDIVVASVASLLNQLFSFDPKHRRRTAFLRDVKWLVVDEADLMLTGSFSRDTFRLLGLLKAEEKAQHKREKELEVREKVEKEQSLPWTHFSQENADDEGNQNEEDESWLESELEEGSSESSLENSGEIRKLTNKERFREFLRLKKEYRRSKRYIFVAATLPEVGKKSAGEELKKLFPEAVWIKGRQLHHTNAKLNEQWLKVAEEDKLKATVSTLERILNEEHGIDGTPPRVLVFVNSANSVDLVGKALRTSGVPCQLFHAEIPLNDRLAALHSLSQDGGVVLSTDAMARGVDIPNISHVIQAEFALSAVDYLHRVGRTARAGQTGSVVNIFTKANADLVAAVRASKEAGEPIEGAFSRKRSFRKKLRKFGPKGGELHQANAMVL